VSKLDSDEPAAAAVAAAGPGAQGPAPRALPRHRAGRSTGRAWGKRAGAVRGRG